MGSTGDRCVEGGIMRFVGVMAVIAAMPSYWRNPL